MTMQTTIFTRHVRLALFCTTAAMLLLGAAPAILAAENPTPDADAQATNSTNTQSGTTAASDKSATELGNVTVTAQSRTQEVQDVPIPMQIVTSTQIDKLAATDLSKMDGYIPGLVVGGEQPTQPNYGLRGIYVSDFGIGTDSPIGIYEDGVYAGKSGGALLMFNDIQRVEVLKGPQGTLFGRNSAGGAISVVTNDPGDTWEAQALTRLGNYGEHYLDGMLNIPLSPDLAFRLSFVDNQSRGWEQDAATGQHYNKNDDWGTRAQLRWNAPGDTVVKLSWEHERLKQPARPAIGLVDLPAAPGLPPVPADPNSYLDPRTAPIFNDVIDDQERRNFDAFTLRIEHPFAFGDLTSITAYRHFSTFNREDQDGTNRLDLYFDDVNIERNSSWSQEFKLAGKNDLADWVGGVSYYYDNAHQTSQLNFFTNSIDTLLNNTGIVPGGLYGPITQALQASGFQYSLLGDPWQENMLNHNVSKSYAAYGDVIWHLTDRLNLTTGVRFTRDEREFSWYNPPRTATQLDQTLSDLQVFGLLDAIGIPIETFQQNIEFNTPISTAKPLVVSNNWSDTSPRAVLDYKLTPNVMVYGSATRGYQAGGYNFDLPGSHYDPETVWNYEAGIKSYFPDYRLLVNASVYYYKYSNLQSLSLVSNGNGNLPLYVVTVSDQEAKGFELEAHWQATDSLRLNFTSAYIDSTYKDYVTQDPVTGETVDLSGQATGEPLWSAAIGLDYVLHDIVGGDVDFTVQDAYRGKSRCNAESVVQGNCLITPHFKLGTAQNRTDLRVGWSSPNVPWSVALFVNNAFDKRYVNGINNISATVLGTPNATITAPRIWGVEAAVHF